MNKSRTMKLFHVILCLSLLGSCLIGCKAKVDENGSMTAEDGRSYGGVIEVEEGNVADTAFFQLKVDEAYQYETYQFEDGLYQAEEGNSYVVLKVTITNTYEKDLPMSITDFILDYEGNQEKDPIVGHGNTDLKDDQYMDHLFTLKNGESITKYIMYTVKEKEDYTLKYSEYYEDKLQGNTFCIKVHPKKR